MERGIQGRTGKVLLSKCDLRRIQAVRELDQEREVTACELPAPFKLTLGDAFTVNDASKWRKVQQVVQRVGMKASGKFKNNSIAFKNAKEALDGGVLEVERALGMYQDRNVARLCDVLTPICGDKAAIVSQQEVIQKLNETIPPHEEVGLQHLTTDTSVHAKFDELRSKAAQELDVMFSVIRDVSDLEFSTIALCQDRMPKFTRLASKYGDCPEFKKLFTSCSKQLGVMLMVVAQKWITARFIQHWKQVWQGVLPKLDSFAKFKLNEPIVDNNLDVVALLRPLGAMLMGQKLEFKVETTTLDIHGVAVATELHKIFCCLEAATASQDKVVTYAENKGHFEDLVTMVAEWRKETRVSDTIYNKFNSLIELAIKANETIKDNIVKNATANLATSLASLERATQHDEMLALITATSADLISSEVLDTLGRPLATQVGAHATFAQAYFEHADALTEYSHVTSKVGIEESKLVMPKSAASLLGIISSVQCLTKDLSGPKKPQRSDILKELGGMVDLTTVPEGLKKHLRVCLPDLDKHVGPNP